jgi:hypothetical protein
MTEIFSYSERSGFLAVERYVPHAKWMTNEQIYMNAIKNVSQYRVFAPLRVWSKIIENNPF